MRMFRYRAAGLTIQSEIDFLQIDTDPAPSAGPADVVFRQGALPADGPVLRLDTFGCAAIDARQVVVWLSEAAAPHAVGQAVAAAGLNGIAYRRGLLPLHAASVAIGTECVALCGETGSGKSTLAAALALAGHRLISDDLLVVHDAAAGPVAWPAASRPRLTREAIDLLEAPVRCLTTPLRRDGKAVVAVGADAAPVPRRLTAIYLLAWGTALELRRLSPLEACQVLHACLRRPDWMAATGATSVIRRRWLDLVADTPVILATRPRGSASLSALADHLSSSWRREGAGDGASRFL